MNRLLVLGIDGGTFSLIDPLVRQGCMPFLKSLMEGGARGLLRSADPPYTGPGWSSFMTGTNPGKHSNYDLERRTLDFRGLEPVGYHTLNGTTIWDIASRAQMKTVLLNMPVSYPPPAIDGTVICGALTPSNVQRFTYPETLRDEIESRFGPYTFDIAWARYKESERDRLLDDLDSMMKQQEDVFLWAMERHEWDFAVAVFVAPDRIQHSLWKWLGVDEPVPANMEWLRDKAYGLYERMDTSIKRLVSSAGDSCNVMLVSDHGFTSMKSRVDLNHVLADKGYFVFRTGSNLFDVAAKPLHKIGLRRRHVGKIMRGLGLSKKILENVESGNRLQGTGSVTEWSKTRAFCILTNGVHINVKGREPEGIVSEDEYEPLRDELIASLEGLKDPSTGETVIHRVQKREEIYSGPFLEYAPDLMITAFDERYHFYFFPQSHYDHAFNPPGMATGNHAYDGILIGKGPDIRPGSVEGAGLIDIMPTMCQLLGLPIPEDVDGSVLQSMLESSALDRKSVSIEGGEQAQQSPEISDEERKGLEDRLRGLGYL